jgi:hypothetical protein
MSDIPLPVLIVVGLILLGGVMRLLGSGGKPKSERTWQDPMDESEAHYLIDRDHHWDHDGRMEEEDGM